VLDKYTEFQLTLREAKLTKEDLTTKVIQFLGEIGGHSHLLVESKFAMKNSDADLAKTIEESDSKANEQIVWDYQASVQFPLPLFNRKIDVNLSRVLPR